MQKDKMIKLAEELDSIGYEIVKIDKLPDVDKYRYFGSIEILLSFKTPATNPLSKEDLIKLIEVLYSNNYFILEYESTLNNNYCRFTHIKLTLA
jgi:hypothetical protein